MGWAARARVGARQRQRDQQHRQFVKTTTRLELLRQRIAKGQELTDADHRIIAKAGPETLRWLGYERRVEL